MSTFLPTVPLVRGSLGVQVHPLDAMLACHRDLTPTQTLPLNSKQGGISCHSTYFGTIQMGTEPQPLSLRADILVFCKVLVKINVRKLLKTLNYIAMALHELHRAANTDSKSIGILETTVKLHFAF